MIVSDVREGRYPRPRVAAPVALQQTLAASRWSQLAWLRELRPQPQSQDAHHHEGTTRKAMAQYSWTLVEPLDHHLVFGMTVPDVRAPIAAPPLVVAALPARRRIVWRMCRFCGASGSLAREHVVHRVHGHSS